MRIDLDKTTVMLFDLVAANPESEPTILESCIIEAIKEARARTQPTIPTKHVIIAETYAHAYDWMQREPTFNGSVRVVHDQGSLDYIGGWRLESPDVKITVLGCPEELDWPHVRDVLRSRGYNG